MAGASISIDLSDLTKMNAALEAAYKRSQDLSPLMDAIGLALETTTDERFDTGRAPDGSAWPKGKKTEGKTLINLAFLKNSIGNRREVTPSSVEIGSNLAYARIHDQGFDGEQAVAAHSREVNVVFGRRLNAPKTQNVAAHTRQMTMPKRQFLGIGGDDPQTMRELTADYLLQDLAA